MLPLHGQSTAAVKTFHWAGPTPYVQKTRSHVFDKQAKRLFAEFLSSVFDLILYFEMSVILCSALKNTVILILAYA